MKKRTKNIIFITCVVTGILLFIAWLYSWWTFLPTRSSSQTLSITLYQRFIFNRPVITLKQYIDELHIVEYTLEIKNGVHIQEPQSYELPELHSGTVEINCALGDSENSSFTISYNEASNFYQEGLLIYITDNMSEYVMVDGIEYYDKYIYFVSGKEETCYYKSAYSPEWLIITDAPPLKGLKRNEPAPYIVNYCGWRENRWVVREETREDKGTSDQCHKAKQE